MNDYLKILGASLLTEEWRLRIRKWMSARRLRTGQYNREPEFSILGYFVKRGSLALDIGANLGYYTAELARLVGDEGRVIAFEPIPEAYERLTYAISKLGLQNTKVYQIALSDLNGEFNMSVPLDKSGREVLGLSHLSMEKEDGNSRSYSVRAAKLDDINDDLEGLSFIKCDVEGAELKVLKGSIDSIRKYKPIILVEIEDRHLKRYALTSEDVYSYLDDFGYRPYYYDGDKLNECDACVYKYNNYIFIPYEKIASLNNIIKQ